MSDTDFSTVRADDVDDVYAGTSVPGEFRPLTEALGGEQLAITLIRVPPHSDFEQGTGHFHDEVEELYVVARGTLTMRFGERSRRSRPGAVARVAPQTRARTATRATSRSSCGRSAASRPQRRDEDRRLLGGVARRRAGTRAVSAS